MWLQPFHAHAEPNQRHSSKTSPPAPGAAPGRDRLGHQPPQRASAPASDPKGQGWDRLPGSVGPGLQGGGSRTEQQSRVPGGQGGEPGSGRSALSTGEGRRAERGEHGDAVQQREPRLCGRVAVCRVAPGAGVVDMCWGGSHVSGWRPCAGVVPTPQARTPPSPSPGQALPPPRHRSQVCCEALSGPKLPCVPVLSPVLSPRPPGTRSYSDVCHGGREHRSAARAVTAPLHSNARHVPGARGTFGKGLRNS